MPKMPLISIQKPRSNLQCYHPRLQLSQGEKPLAILNQEQFVRTLKGRKILKILFPRGFYSTNQDNQERKLIAQPT